MLTDEEVDNIVLNIKINNIAILLKLLLNWQWKLEYLILTIVFAKFSPLQFCHLLYILSMYKLYSQRDSFHCDRNVTSLNYANIW